MWSPLFFEVGFAAVSYSPTHSRVQYHQRCQA